MAKPKIGMYCAAGCGGCDIALLEIQEHLLELVAAADIVVWPTATDFKYSDVEAMPDGAIDVCLINGSVRNGENARIVRLLRAKSKAIVAFGACSAFGGIPGLGNLYTTGELVDRAFTTESTTPADCPQPSGSAMFADGADAGLPEMSVSVQAISSLIDVDYLLPGCPPAADRVWESCLAIVGGTLPKAPAIVGAGTKCVCDDCSLTKRDTRVARFVRTHEIVPEPGWCLLEQGVVCLGPATRSGCGGQCTSALMPCRGCYGPAGDSIDQGAKMIATLGTIIDSEDEQTILAAVDAIVDPAGTFYSFTLPTSVLGHARGPAVGGPEAGGSR